MAESNMRKNRFTLPYSLRSVIKNLEAETEAEVIKKCCLLPSSPWPTSPMEGPHMLYPLPLAQPRRCSEAVHTFPIQLGLTGVQFCLPLACVLSGLTLTASYCPC